MLISSLGHFHPTNKINNEFFDSLDIGSQAEWVTDRTGIVERRSVLNNEQLNALKTGETTFEKLRDEKAIMSIAEMGKRAWQLLTERNARAAQGVDLVLCGTSIPDYDVPANACSIAAAIGLECTAFDVNSACSSFVVDLHVARSMVQAKTAEKVAIFIPERYTARMDYKDRSSCVLFGDGCGAAVVERKDSGASGLEVLDTWVISSPAKFDLVHIRDGGTFHQVGHAVQKFAISRTTEITQAILQRNNLTLSDVNYIIAHQANLRMLSSSMQKLGIPAEKHLYNVDKFGNQGGAGAIGVLSMNWEKYKPGDIIVVSVVGAGLTWASALFRRS